MTTTNQLEQLRRMTRIVADTGDFGLIKEFSPEDATTNPTLILKAAQKPEYKSVVERVIADGNKQSLAHEAIFQNLLVSVRCGNFEDCSRSGIHRNSAKISFDTRRAPRQSATFISLYEKHGIDRKRVLIKLATTWEGIQAARGPAKGRYQLQYDSALFAATGDRLAPKRTPN